MLGNRNVFVVVAAVLLLGVSSASAFVVIDPATLAKNVAIALLKSDILEVLDEQFTSIHRMARRLSVFADLRRFALPEPPMWRTHGSDDFLYSADYNNALIFGDGTGTAYLDVTRPVTSAAEALDRLTPDAKLALMAQLATLDVADATGIAGLDQTGRLRLAGRKNEFFAIEALEAHVIDPSLEQSATAVLDKISGAVLIETRQKQARIQLLSAIVEQLLVDSKRARDTEVAALNMQLRRLRGYDDEGGGGLLTGAGAALRTWRQP